MINREKLSCHGGNLYNASKLYGLKEEAIIDFSANINPLGIPEGIKELILSKLGYITNYPDPDCNELRNNISEYLNIPPEKIVAGNGASEIIYILLEVLKPSKMLMPAPTFSEYGKSAELAGIKIKYHELKESNDFKLNMDDFIEEICDVDAVLICNPNNPTSTLMNKEDLFRLIKYAAEKNVKVILDEAFIELTEGSNSNSMVEYTKEFENLFIIRAFTKIFAIPGLRLGYGIGNIELVRKIHERKLPWSVNSLAQGMGDFLKYCGSYMKETSNWISEEKDWFYNELKAFKGLKVFKPETNFILLKLLNEEITSLRLQGAMASKGVLIRDASNFMFLNDSFVRVAIKDRESNKVFLNRLKEIL